jgi:hypothetical protein
MQALVRESLAASSQFARSRLGQPIETMSVTTLSVEELSGHEFSGMLEEVKWWVGGRARGAHRAQADHPRTA